MSDVRLMRWAVLGAAAVLMLKVAVPSPTAALSNGQLASAQVGGFSDRIRSKLAQIRVKKRSGTSTCTEVFLSGRVVVTAGHCLIDEKFALVEASSLSASRCLDDTSKACKWVEAKGFDIYPIFKQKAATTSYLRENADKSERFDMARFQSWDFDLAVVLLAKDAASDVGYVPISDRPPIEGETHYHFGAGLTLKGDSGIMKVAPFQVSWTVQGKGALTSQYLMPASTQSGSCGGDSGGPLFVERDESLLLAGIGVASRQTKKGLSCGDIAVIAIDLSRLKFWVDHTATLLQRQHAPPPPALHPSARSAIDRLRGANALRRD